MSIQFKSLLRNKLHPNAYVHIVWWHIPQSSSKIRISLTSHLMACSSFPKKFSNSFSLGRLPWHKILIKSILFYKKMYLPLKLFLLLLKTHMLWPVFLMETFVFKMWRWDFNSRTSANKFCRTLKVNLSINSLYNIT